MELSTEQKTRDHTFHVVDCNERTESQSKRQLKETTVSSRRSQTGRLF